MHLAIYSKTRIQLLAQRHEASAWAEIGAIERHLRKHAGAVARKLINGGGRRANTEVDRDEEDDEDDEENVMAATGQFSNSDDDSGDDDDEDDDEDEEGDDVMDMRSGTRGLGGRKISRGERLRYVVEGVE